MFRVDLYELDLQGVREAVAPLFSDYDRTVATGDRVGAHSAKMQIGREAMQRLRQCMPDAAHGLYFFQDATNSLDGLTYIGMAARNTLIKRTERRFRNDTCLDLSQIGRSREDIWDTAYRRMCVSMASTPDTLIRYAFDHVRMTNLLSNVHRIIYFGTDQEATVIKAAESLLIYSAISAGAPLVNIVERGTLSTVFTPGIELAKRAIAQSGINGEAWLTRAETLCSRFQGNCC